MDAIEKKTYSLRITNNSSNIPLNFLFDHLNGKTTCRKMEPSGVLNKEGDAIVITWDINYSRMWTINKLVTIQDKSCRTNTNKGYTIPRWDTKQ